MGSPFLTDRERFLDIKIISSSYHDKINKILKECFGVTRPFFKDKIHFGKLELVSYLNVTPMSIKLCGEEYKMGGICSVATIPEFRHQGYASALLESVLEWMVDQKFDIAILYAADERLYNALGFIKGPEQLNKKPTSSCEGDILHIMVKVLNPEVIDFDVFKEDCLSSWKNISNF